MENGNQVVDPNAEKLASIDREFEKDFSRLRKSPKSLETQDLEDGAEVTETEGREEQQSETISETKTTAETSTADAESQESKTDESDSERASQEALTEQEQAKDSPDEVLAPRADKRRKELQHEIEKVLVPKLKDTKAELERIERQLTDRKIELGKPQDLTGIQMVENPPQEPVLAVLDKTNVGSYTIANIMAQKDAAQEAGDQELVRRCLGAMNDVERFNQYRNAVQDYNNRQNGIQAERERFTRMTKEKYPDIYNKDSDMANEYRALSQDPAFSHAVKLVSHLPQAPYVVAEMVSDRLAARKAKISLGELTSKLQEKESEITRLKTGKFPPKSTSSQASVEKPNGKKMSLDDKFDSAMDRLVQVRGRRM